MLFEGHHDIEKAHARSISNGYITVSRTLPDPVLIGPASTFLTLYHFGGVLLPSLGVYSSAFGIPTSPPFGIGAWGAPAFAPIPGMCAVAG